MNAKAMDILFYFLFVADIIIGFVVYLFVGWQFGCATAASLLIINATSFYVIKKIQKAEKKSNEQRLK